MSNRLANEGFIYVCGACGKHSPDKYGFAKGRSHGWDVSCTMSSVLVSGEPGTYVAADEAEHSTEVDDDA